MQRQPHSDPERMRTLAHLAVVVAVLTWGCSNVVIKMVPVSGMIASFYRLWLALPLLWLVALATPGTRARLDGNWVVACLVGGVLFSLHQVLFFNGLKMTSIANVAILGALQPVLVLLVAGPWFGEPVGARAVGLSAVAIGGTAYAILGASSDAITTPLGDAFAVANVFAFTAYFLWSKRVRASVGATEYVVGTTTVAALIIAAVCFATGEDVSKPHGSDWVLLWFLALVPGTTGHFLANWAHAHATAFVMSILFLAVPVIAAVGAHVVLGEPLLAAQGLGGLITLVAIAAILRPPRAPEADPLSATVIHVGKQ